MATVPEDLLRYFETHETPEGVSWDEMLARHIGYMSDVAAPRPDCREVTIRTLDGWKLRVAEWYGMGSEKPRGLVFHIHGGAWAAGNHLSFPGIAAMLCQQGYLVVSIDYRRAPRHKFPAAYDDCLFALGWCRSRAAELGVEDRIVVLGESAGANLAAAVLVNDTRRTAKAGVLLYGIYDYHRVVPVMEAIGLPTTYVESSEMAALEADPRLSPLFHCHRLPPCLVLVGEMDWALDQSRWLHDDMNRQGIEHEYGELPATPHGFTLLPGHPGFDEGWRRVFDFLARLESAD